MIKVVQRRNAKSTFPFLTLNTQNKTSGALKEQHSKLCLESEPLGKGGEGMRIAIESLDSNESP